MDATAISLCMDNKLPIVVFNLRTPGNLRRVIMGEPVGTTVEPSTAGGCSERARLGHVWTSLISRACSPK